MSKAIKSVFYKANEKFLAIADKMKLNDGNATFITGPNGVYSPNYTGGTLQMYFNLNDSTGTSYSTQFNSLDLLYINSKSKPVIL
jgi:hypothetical protein